ncbi:glycosyl transferase family 1 [Nitrospira sp.]|nr:glycosyl transferase family 1 [Nitrospira sp.]
MSPSSTGGTAVTGESGTAVGLKHLVLDGLFAYPDPQCAWLKPAVAFARRWPRAEVPDLVYATGGPWTSLLVGKSLAEHWGVPLVVDYRDPWTNNPYVSFVSPILNERVKQLERAVCRRADGLIANTEELKCQLQLSHPEAAQRTVAITNGFDPDSFPEADATGDLQRISSARPSDGVLELCHFGTVYGKRTPAVLLQAVLDLHREGRLTGAQLRLRFVGAWDVDDPRCEELARELEKVGLLTREPPIPYQACLRQMAGAGALLVIQPDSPLQIPGKIYEYIATRRPLVLIGGEGATANLVTRNQFGVACPNSGERIRELFLDLLEERQTLRPPDPSQVSRFSYRTLTAELARVFDAIVTGASVAKSENH